MPALAPTPTVPEPTGKAWDKDKDNNNIELAVRPPLSPRKRKPTPGRERQTTAELSRKFPSPATRATQEKQAFATVFKLGVRHVRHRRRR